MHIYPGEKLYVKWSSSQEKWYNISVNCGWSEFLSIFKRKSEKQIEFLWIREWCQIDLISVGQQLSETYLHSKETSRLHTLKLAVAFQELLSHPPSDLTKPTGVLQQLQLDFPRSARPEAEFSLSFGILNRNKCQPCFLEAVYVITLKWMLPHSLFIHAHICNCFKFHS